MSRISSATLNWPLTTYAQGQMQDRLAAYRLAQILMPIVRVAGAAGTYKKFDDRNSFRNMDTLRGMGGSRKRMAFDATDGTYNCAPHGLEVAIDDHERALVGTNEQLAQELLDQGKIQALLSTKATAYAKRAVDFVIANETAVSSRGEWSNQDIDPIDQIDEQLEALVTDVGTAENITVVIGLPAWTLLRRNAKAKARVVGISPSVTRESFLAMLSVPVKLEIAAISYTATKRGQSSVTKTNVVGNYALLQYSVPNPTLYDPTPYKCFSTSDVLVESVRTYRDENASSDIHTVDWSEYMAETSSVAARMLAIT